MWILAAIALVIAAILELTSTHLGAVIWLIIAGGLLLCAEAGWHWNRAGRTYRRTGA